MEKLEAIKIEPLDDEVGIKIGEIYKVKRIGKLKDYIIDYPNIFNDKEWVLLQEQVEIIEEKSMNNKFEIWIDPLDKFYSNIIEQLVKDFNYQKLYEDDETEQGIIEIRTMEEFQDVCRIFDDDCVLYGPNLDVIMTKKLLYSLGLY